MNPIAELEGSESETKTIRKDDEEHTEETDSEDERDAEKIDLLKVDVTKPKAKNADLVITEMP